MAPRSAWACCRTAGSRRAALGGAPDRFAPEPHSGEPITADDGAIRPSDPPASHLALFRRSERHASEWIGAARPEFVPLDREQPIGQQRQQVQVHAQRIRTMRAGHPAAVPIAYTCGMESRPPAWRRLLASRARRRWNLNPAPAESTGQTWGAGTASCEVLMCRKQEPASGRDRPVALHFAPGVGRECVDRFTRRSGRLAARRRP